MCEAFRHEKSLIVWQDLISNLRYIGILLQERKGDAGEIEALKRYSKELLIPIVQQLGWEPVAGERARHWQFVLVSYSFTMHINYNVHNQLCVKIVQLINVHTTNT